MEPITIKPVSGKKDLKKFIQLPYKIHRNHEKWVPPLYQEEWSFFDPKKNAAFQKNDTILLLAFRGNQVIGRIMGIINRQRNKQLSERVARFGNLECENDLVVARALLQSVEQWASEKGMEKVVGPMGFSDQDPEGYIIEGFDYEPTIATYYNFEYVPNLLDKLDYTKEVDYVVYRIDLTRPVPEVYQRIVDRLVAQPNVTFPSIRTHRDLKTYLKPCLQLMNSTFTDLYGYDPLTENEIEAIGKKFLPIIYPDFVKVAYRNNDIAGFILGIPNLNSGFRKANGKLFPLGWYHLLRAPARTNQLDLLLAALRADFRGMGGDAYGMLSIIQAARAAGYTILDSHHELENNLRVRRVMERLGGSLDKRFRIYQKQLDT